jgi:hypothetical protein
MKVYRLDLNDVVQHPGRRVEYLIEIWLEREEAPPLAEPIRGALIAESGGRILRLSGAFRTVVWLECGRCLRYFQLPVAFEIHEEFPLAGTPAGLERVWLRRSGRSGLVPCVRGELALCRRLATAISAAGVADGARLQGGLQGLVSDLRAEPERSQLRLCAESGASRV